MMPGYRELRVSDHDREAVIRTLRLAVGEGRLTLAEFDERVQSACAARIRGELDDLTQDLPRDLW